MKHLSIIGMLLLMGIASNALAGECETAGYSSLNGPDVISALSGKRVAAEAPDGEEWNEDHCTTALNSPGALFKVGDGSAVDPRAFRGTWTPRGGNPAKVEYSYTVGGSSSYTWTIWGKTGGSLCWEGSGGSIIAIAPEPGAAGSPCTVP